MNSEMLVQNLNINLNSQIYESNVAKFSLHGTQRLLSISTPFTKYFSSSYKAFDCSAENYL